MGTVNRLREGGMERAEAILVATERRFRPIMMTAITTIGGMVPLAINGRLESGISYTSFAWTLIGGLSTATLLTLLVIPVLYDRIIGWLGTVSDTADRAGVAVAPATA